MSTRELRRREPNMFDEPCTTKSTKKDTCKEPDEWTIISALDRVLDQARGSELDEAFWNTCRHPLDFLNKTLELTDIQILIVAMLVEAGEPLSWRKFGNYLGISRLSMMVYVEEVEDLLKKRWIVRRISREMGVNYEGFMLAQGVIKSLRNNEKFVPEKIDGLTEQQFVDRLEWRMGGPLMERSSNFAFDEEWMEQMCKANPQLPLCQTALSFGDIHSLSLLLLTVVDYAQWADSDAEGLDFPVICDVFPEEYECNGMRSKLMNETHVVLRQGWLEHGCTEGIAEAERFVLSAKAKNELLSAYTPSRSRVRKHRKSDRSLRRFDTITEKPLFFNAAEQEQIDRLTHLLSQDSLPSIQQRLEEQGMRKGFACLFYGAPGTGKTETVLQIARLTGRDIMQIDIAGLRDKFVGESEKNIKSVFTRYRELCKTSDVMPILFFNEADAILGKRMENVERSVEKMDNAMQNIILQEIEDLDGILIATTNLTSNLDAAFERRFLFKVEFHKPDTEAKTKIWASMLKNLSEEDAHTLAVNYNFSGGQIENIARKRTIDYILSGELATLDRIESYCQNELLDDKKERQHIAGFGRAV